MFTQISFQLLEHFLLKNHQYSFLDGKKFKFWKVEILLSQPEYESQDNGTIIKSDSKDGLYIKAKDGIIKVLEIQAENAKKMNIGDF